MKRIVRLGPIALWIACGWLHAQAPAPLSNTYQFPFWSDGDVDSGDKPFHIGYRTGFVISNPNAEPVKVDLFFNDSDGRTVVQTLSDGQGTSRFVAAHATVNITTPAAWQSAQRFGNVTASSESKFMIAVEVQLVHIPNPAIVTPVARDPRISVMRMEAARTAGVVLISWERSATTDTAFIFANTVSQALILRITSFSGLKQIQSVKELFVGAGATVIYTIGDLDSFPSLLEPGAPRNHGFIRIEAPNGMLVTGVVFRTVQDPIVLPAALATP